ncbi:serine acetyltransferase [Pelomyxa schiedti]|nr:serine acetyltransferase [Pelomyxa schiedti]
MTYVWPVPLAPFLDTIASDDVLSALQRSYDADSEDRRFTSLVAASSLAPQSSSSSSSVLGGCAVTTTVQPPPPASTAPTPSETAQPPPSPAVAPVVGLEDTPNGSSEVSLRQLHSTKSSSSSSITRYVTFPTRTTFTELDLLMEVMWPRFYNCYELCVPQNKALLREKLYHLAGVMFDGMFPYHQDVSVVSTMLGTLFLQFGVIRELLKKDVLAAYQGDPAAASFAEIIRCYPSLAAVMIQRVAHELYLLKALVYPRELCEMVHRLTAIDLHPGAKIGEFFFIDHGVGTVIGETAELGSWCRLYQNVTLGALHFEIDETTKSLKKGGYKRHPTVGNHVVIGTGAKLLGPITVGDNVSIGANSWIQEDIPDNTVVFIRDHPAQMKKAKRT